VDRTYAADELLALSTKEVLAIQQLTEKRWRRQAGQCSPSCIKHYPNYNVK